MIRRLTSNARRALQMLADDPQGFPEAVLMAHGVTDDLLRMLVRARLVRGQIETAAVADGRTVEIIRLTITEAGRQALERDPKKRRP